MTRIVIAFAMEGDFDVAALNSNTFTIEWPPKSGRQASIPEADRAAWFTLPEAETKIVERQRRILAAPDAHLATR